MGRGGGVWAWRVNEENPREELKPIDFQARVEGPREWVEAASPSP